MATYLAWFKDSFREHTEFDLRSYLCCCAERGLGPPTVRRPHLELYIWSMQEVRRRAGPFSFLAGAAPRALPIS